MRGVVKGGNNNSGSLSLQQNIKVFIQATQPTSTQIGDVWLNTTKTVNKVVLFNWEETYPSLTSGVAVINLYDIKLREMFQKAFSVFSNRAEINVEYNTAKMLNQLGTNDLKVFRNTLMEVYAKLGAVKLYTSATDFEFVKGLYWTGTAWVEFSPDDLYIYIAGSGSRYIVKVDPTGGIVWKYQHTSGPNCVAVSLDGYVYFGVGSGGIGKLSPNGALLWAKTPVSLSTSVLNIAVDKDGNVYYTCNMSVIKTDSEGNKLWQYNYDNGPISLAIDSYCNVYVVSSTYGYVEKVSSSGVQILKFRNPSQQEGYSVATAPNGGYLSGHNLGYLCKYNSAGTALWYKQVISSYDVFDIATDKNDNTYIITDYNNLAKLDAAGTVVWQSTEVKAVAIGISKTLEVDKHGYIYVVSYGDSTSGVTVWKLDNDGHIINTFNFPASQGLGVNFRDITITHSPYGAFPFLN